MVPLEVSIELNSVEGTKEREMWAKVPSNIEVKFSTLDVSRVENRVAGIGVVKSLVRNV